MPATTTFALLGFVIGTGTTVFIGIIIMLFFLKQQESELVEKAAEDCISLARDVIHEISCGTDKTDAVFLAKKKGAEMVVEKIEKFFSI